MEIVEFRIELFPGAKSVHEEQSRQKTVVREGVQHFAQRGVATSKRIGFRGHRDFDAPQQCPTRFVEEGEEQRLLAREMKVESAL